MSSSELEVANAELEIVESEPGVVNAALRIVEFGSGDAKSKQGIVEFQSGVGKSEQGIVEFESGIINSALRIDEFELGIVDSEPRAVKIKRIFYHPKSDPQRQLPFPGLNSRISTSIFFCDNFIFPLVGNVPRYVCIVKRVT